MSQLPNVRGEGEQCEVKKWCKATNAYYEVVRLAPEDLLRKIRAGGRPFSRSVSTAEESVAGHRSSTASPALPRALPRLQACRRRGRAATCLRSLARRAQNSPACRPCVTTSATAPGPRQHRRAATLDQLFASVRDLTQSLCGAELSAARSPCAAVEMTEQSPVRVLSKRAREREVEHVLRTHPASQRSSEPPPSFETHCLRMLARSVREYATEATAARPRELESDDWDRESRSASSDAAGEGNESVVARPASSRLLGTARPRVAPVRLMEVVVHGRGRWYVAGLHAVTPSVHRVEVLIARASLFLGVAPGQQLLFDVTGGANRLLDPASTLAGAGVGQHSSLWLTPRAACPLVAASVAALAVAFASSKSSETPAEPPSDRERPTASNPHARFSPGVDEEGTANFSGFTGHPEPVSEKLVSELDLPHLIKKTSGRGSVGVAAEPSHTAHFDLPRVTSRGSVGMTTEGRHSSGGVTFDAPHATGADGIGAARESRQPSGAATRDLPRVTSRNSRGFPAATTEGTSETPRKAGGRSLDATADGPPPAPSHAAAPRSLGGCESFTSPGPRPLSASSKHDGRHATDRNLPVASFQRQLARGVSKRGKPAVPLDPLMHRMVSAEHHPPNPVDSPAARGNAGSPAPAAAAGSAEARVPSPDFDVSISPFSPNVSLADADQCSITLDEPAPPQQEARQRRSVPEAAEAPLTTETRSNPPSGGKPRPPPALLRPGTPPTPPGSPAPVPPRKAAKQRKKSSNAPPPAAARPPAPGSPGADGLLSADADAPRGLSPLARKRQRGASRAKRDGDAAAAAVSAQASDSLRAHHPPPERHGSGLPRKSSSLSVRGTPGSGVFPLAADAGYLRYLRERPHNALHAVVVAPGLFRNRELDPIDHATSDALKLEGVLKMLGYTVDLLVDNAAEKHMLPTQENAREAITVARRMHQAASLDADPGSPDHVEPLLLIVVQTRGWARGGPDVKGKEKYHLSFSTDPERHATKLAELIADTEPTPPPKAGGKNGARGTPARQPVWMVDALKSVMGYGYLYVGIGPMLGGRDVPGGSLLGQSERRGGLLLYYLHRLLRGKGCVPGVAGLSLNVLTRTLAAKLRSLCGVHAATTATTKQTDGADWDLCNGARLMDARHFDAEKRRLNETEAWFSLTGDVHPDSETVFLDRWRTTLKSLRHTRANHGGSWTPAFQSRIMTHKRRRNHLQMLVQGTLLEYEKFDKYQRSGQLDALVRIVKLEFLPDGYRHGAAITIQRAWLGKEVRKHFLIAVTLMHQYTTRAEALREEETREFYAILGRFSTTAYTATVSAEENQRQEIEWQAMNGTAQILIEKRRHLRGVEGVERQKTMSLESGVFFQVREAGERLMILLAQYREGRSLFSFQKLESRQIWRRFQIESDSFGSFLAIRNDARGRVTVTKGPPSRPLWPVAQKKLSDAAAFIRQMASSPTAAEARQAFETDLASFFI
ncbi:hypothetical protein DIPPA_04442 [Diplonema papillatum]|nr:hypothetical protein DIPPA_04442 [Diplonema papillatum]